MQQRGAEVSRAASERRVCAHLLGGSSLGDSHRDTQDGVGAKLALVGRAVELDHPLVNLSLRRDGEAGLDEGRADNVVHVGDSLLDACAGSHGLNQQA